MLKKLSYLVLIIFVILTGLSFFYQTPINYLEQFVTDNSILSISIFIFLMFISTVISPITVLPMVPVVALFLGSFNTAIYSIIGWTLGSIVAFVIARYFGKPVLDKFVSERDLLKYRKYVPKDINFWWVVFLRMTIPVDILSYLVGLFTEMSFLKYLLATIIGIIPFSFIFSYGYEIVFLNNILGLILSTVFVIAIMFFSWYFHSKGRF